MGVSCISFFFQATKNKNLFYHEIELKMFEKDGDETRKIIIKRPYERNACKVYHYCQYVVV